MTDPVLCKHYNEVAGAPATCRLLEKLDRKGDHITKAHVIGAFAQAGAPPFEPNHCPFEGGQACPYYAVPEVD